jgi:hypothetical protein
MSYLPRSSHHESHYCHELPKRSYDPRSHVLKLMPTIFQASRNIFELALYSVCCLQVLEGTYDLKSSDDSESCSIFMFHISCEVSILCPGADDGHERAETKCVTIYRQDISMLESCTCSELTLYPLQNSNVWREGYLQSAIGNAHFGLFLH